MHNIELSKNILIEIFFEKNNNRKKLETHFQEKNNKNNSILHAHAGKQFVFGKMKCLLIFSLSKMDLRNKKSKYYIAVGSNEG